MPNLRDSDHGSVPREFPGFECLRAKLGEQLGAERLGLSLWEVPPGKTAYPYHFHLAEEELVIVLEGEPHLRTPEGWRVVPEGEILRFGVGEEGAHQLDNRTDATVRFLAVSTRGAPEIVVYPDEDKVGLSDREPGGNGLDLYFRAGDAVDYHEGVRPPDRS